MPTNDSEPWSDHDQKVKAIYKVLHYLAQNPADGLACVGKDDEAAKLFTKVGGIDVPEGQRVIFFAPGEQALRHKNSVILEIPSADATDLELKPYVLGNYPYWPGGGG